MPETRGACQAGRRRCFRGGAAATPSARWTRSSPWPSAGAPPAPPQADVGIGWTLAPGPGKRSSSASRGEDADHLRRAAGGRAPGGRRSRPRASRRVRVCARSRAGRGRHLHGGGGGRGRAPRRREGDRPRPRRARLRAARWEPCADLARETVALAGANGLDFVGVHPHIWSHRTTRECGVDAFIARAATLCAEGPRARRRARPVRPRNRARLVLRLSARGGPGAPLAVELDLRQPARARAEVALTASPSRSSSPRRRSSRSS